MVFIQIKKKDLCMVAATWKGTNGERLDMLKRQGLNGLSGLRKKEHLCLWTHGKDNRISISQTAIENLGFSKETELKVRDMQTWIDDIDIDDINRDRQRQSQRHRYRNKKFYYKDLAHVILVADKSQDPQGKSVKQRPKRANGIVPVQA